MHISCIISLLLHVHQIHADCVNNFSRNPRSLRQHYFRTKRNGSIPCVIDNSIFLKQKTLKLGCLPILFITRSRIVRTTPFHCIELDSHFSHCYIMCSTTLHPCTSKRFLFFFHVVSYKVKFLTPILPTLHEK